MATDTATPVRPAVAALLAEAAQLTRDRDRGAWTPTRLERRISARLCVATAGDGLLTEDRVRDALWEGSLPLLQENGGRFAALLAAVLRALDQDARREASEHGGADRDTTAAVDDVTGFLLTTAVAHARA